MLFFFLAVFNLLWNCVMIAGNKGKLTVFKSSISSTTYRPTSLPSSSWVMGFGFAMFLTTSSECAENSDIVIFSGSKLKIPIVFPARKCVSLSISLLSPFLSHPLLDTQVVCVLSAYVVSLREVQKERNLHLFYDGKGLINNNAQCVR